MLVLPDPVIFTKATMALLPLTMVWLFIIFCLALRKVYQFKNMRAKRTIYLLLAATCAFGIVHRGTLLIPAFGLPVTGGNRHEYIGIDAYFDYVYPRVLFEHVFDACMSVIPALVVHFCLIATDQSMVQSASGWLVLLSYFFALATLGPAIAYLVMPLALSRIVFILTMLCNGLFLFYPLTYIFYCVKYAASYGVTFILFCLFQALYIIYPFASFTPKGISYTELVFDKNLALFCVFFCIFPCVAATFAVICVPNWKWQLTLQAYNSHPPPAAANGYFVPPHTHQEPSLLVDKLERPLPATPDMAPKTEIA
ncbi:hypothetical protein BC940DRAFT_334282 [Gongronella butleri]|nr:hypothetical protein BC940DRAFT_334282 [Gongronella butleri]